MTNFDSAVKAVQEYGNRFQPVLESWPAYLGDGSGVVIGSEKRLYNCRYPTTESPSVEVYANGCPPCDGLRVMVGRTADQPDLIQVLSWNDPVLDNKNQIIPYHADQHAWLGGDTVYIDWRQITTLRVIAAYNTLVVFVYGGVLPRLGSDIYVEPQDVDLSGSVPDTANQGRYALLSIDTTGAVVVTNGTPVTPYTTLDIPDIPDTPAGNFRIAAVQLIYGQTTITEDLTRTDIIDLRWPQETVAGLISPGNITLATNSILAGVAGVATAVAVGEQTLIGRITGGAVAPLSVAQIRTLIGAGSGGGLDADLLDGNHAAAFATATHDMIAAHTYTGGAALDVFGLSGANTIARLTPSSNPGAASALLKSDASGLLTLVGLLTGKIYPTADSTTAVQILRADGTTPIVNIDTTYGQVTWHGVGGTSPMFKIHSPAGEPAFSFQADVWGDSASFKYKDDYLVFENSSGANRFAVMMYGTPIAGVGTIMSGAGVTYSAFNINGSQLFVGADSAQESPMMQIVPSYVVNTHASYTSRSVFSQWAIGGAQEVMRFESGAAPLWGVFGASAARAAHIADATDAADVITRVNAMLVVLENFGLVATS